MHFEEMALHNRNLKRFDIKVALSSGITGKLLETWSGVIHPQHKRFLLSILTSHFTKDCPTVSIELSECSMTPPFLPTTPELNEWVEEWLRSLAACFVDENFNSGGAILASWSRDEFVGRQDVEFRCPSVFEHIPIKRTQAEWDLLAASLEQHPIPYSPALRVYADEGGDGGSPEWIGVVVISESDANHIIQVAVEEFNDSHPREHIRVVHFCEIPTEQNRLALAYSIVEKLCCTDVACFIVRKNSRESKDRLYARGLGEVLSKWPKLSIEPIYIDTPYDLKNDDLKNKRLRNQIFQVLQNKQISCTTKSIILDKERNTPGLGLADTIAYLYLHKSEPQWRRIWQKLDQRGKYFSI